MNPLTKRLTIHPKILTDICMQVGLMGIPHQIRKSVNLLVLFEFKTQQQP